MSDKAHYVGDYRAHIACLNNAHGLLAAVLLWRPRPVAIMDASGAWIDGTRVRGSRIHALAMSGITAAARAFNLLRGHLQTKGGQGLAIGSDATITRSAGGSFIAEGYQPGQRVLLLDTDPAAEDGGLATQILNRRVATITGVAAQTLTFAAGTFVTGQAALAATVGLYRVAGIGGAIPTDINNGNAQGKYPVSLLNQVVMPWTAAKPDGAVLMGPNHVLLASVAGTALPAGETLDFVTEGGDY